MTRLCLMLALALVPLSCAKAPPNLTPAASVAWKQHEVQKDLDLIRDIAQDANAQGALSTPATRTVTLWHRSAITVVHEAKAGWKAAVIASLDELQSTFPSAEYPLIAKYVALAKAVLQEVVS